MNKVYMLIVLIKCLKTTMVFSQHTEPFFGYQYSYAPMGQVTVQNKNTTKTAFSSKIIKAFINMDVPIAEKNIFFGSCNYFGIINKAEGKNRGTDEITIPDYNDFIASIGIISEIKQGLNITFMASTIFNTNYNKELENIWAYDLTGLVVKEKSNNFFYGCGLYSYFGKSGIFFIPLVSVDYKLRKFTVYGILPENLEIDYKVSKKIGAGLHFNGYFGTYKPDGQINDLPDDYTDIINMDFSINLDFYPVESVQLFFKSGVMIYKYLIPNYKNAVTFKPMPHFSTGLNFYY